MFFFVSMVFPSTLTLGTTFVVVVVVVVAVVCAQLKSLKLHRSVLPKDIKMSAAALALSLIHI